MIGQHFREILHFWWHNLGALFLVTAPFALLNEASQWLFGPTLLMEGERITGFNSTSILLLLLLRPLAEAALIIQLSATQSGKPRGFIACALPALMIYPALLVTYVIIGLGVSLGWLLLFFPALWVYTRLSIAPFLVVLKGASPIQALRDSFALTRQHQWALLLTLVLLFIAVLMIGSTVSGILVGLLGHNGGTQLVTAVITALLGASINVAILRYWGLAQQQPAE